MNFESVTITIDYLRLSDYSNIYSLRIFCGTWNVNAKRCDNDSTDISEWLLPNGCDIYVISLQEIVQLNVTNVVVSNEQTDDAVKYWIHKLYTLLNESFTQGCFVTVKLNDYFHITCVLIRRVVHIS